MDKQILTNLLKQDAFGLFALPQEYSINLTMLNDKYHRLQKTYHPDNFIDHENLALIAEVSAHINQSFTLLKSPLNRAVCLLGLHGQTLDLNSNNNLPQHLLTTQIELHEEIIESATNLVKLQGLESKINQQQSDLETQIAHEFSIANFERVKDLVIELSFYARLNTQIATNILRILEN